MPLIDPVTGAGIIESTSPPKSLPIAIVNTDLARLASHLHPVLLLGNYYWNFPALVADPVGSLAVGILPLVLTQALWCAVCLPVAGSGDVKNKSGKGKGGRGQLGAFKDTSAGVRGKKAESIRWTEKIVPIILSLTLTQVAIPVLFIVAILLGAPVTTHIPHTALLATHLALLTVFPLIYVHGADTNRWIEIAGFACPFDGVWGGTVGALVGGWLGAVPIPLDWDREWQRWPITIVTGVYGGYVIGKVLGEWVLRGRRIPLEA